MPFLASVHLRLDSPPPPTYKWCQHRRTVLHHKSSYVLPLMSQARQAGIVEESISRHCVPQRLASDDLAMQKEKAMNYIHAVQRTAMEQNVGLTPLAPPDSHGPWNNTCKGKERAGKAIPQQNRIMGAERGPRWSQLIGLTLENYIMALDPWGFFLDFRKTHEERSLSAGQMGFWIKHLLHMHEDQSSDPQNRQ